MQNKQAFLKENYPIHTMTINAPQNRHNPTLWVITEGIAGTENQCIGVADALNVGYEVRKVRLRQPWKTLSPYLGLERSFTFEPTPRPPWPDILITSGRKSIAAARYIKKKNPETFSVHIQDPKISASHFDLVAVPEHDRLRGDNVIVTSGAPNKLTQDVLNHAKSEFDFSSLPSPLVAVLIGGDSNAYSMSESITAKLADDLARINGSLLITCSRRTGKKNEALLRKKLDNSSNFFWNGSGVNPYFGILAWADYILVTADSASMISESCTTGKPTFMIPLEGGGKRINAFHENLISSRCLRVFDGHIENYDYLPLNDSQIVANEIKKRYEGFTRAK
ncbi:MAG: mitochondrial fission ELM1 family protein [Alphaproteobacteria bacterium]